MKITTLKQGETVRIGESVECPHCKKQFDPPARQHDILILESLGKVKIGVNSSDRVRKLDPDN